PTRTYTLLPYTTLFRSLDQQDEPIVVRLRLPWHELKCAGARRAARRNFAERGRKIAGQVALARQEQRRSARGVTLWHSSDDHLLDRKSTRLNSSHSQRS